MYKLSLRVPIGNNNTLANQLQWKCHACYFDIIVMFGSKERLKQRTPKNGIDRKEFIHLLVDEYYETTNVGELNWYSNRKPAV